ncbi:MAG: ABC transporter permease subunit [Sphingobacteriia bacterium]|nr:ABC transporter permease subunit [Sphingobacteriia bacterium]
MLRTLIVAFLLILNSCKSDDNNKILKVGISADYPPFDMMIEGEVTGIDADVAKLIANELGYKLKIIEMDFASLIPAINSGIIDFAISNISKTDERAKIVDFTIPYYEAKSAFIYNKNLKISNLTDAKKLIIGVQTGTVFESSLLTKGFTKIKSLSRIPMLLEELKSNRINILFLDRVQAESILKNNPQFTLYEVTEIISGQAVIALPKNSSLTKDFNQVIDKYQKNGELNKITQKWFKFNFEDSKLFLGIFNVKHIEFIAKGIPLTIAYAILSTLIGLIIGLVITALANLNKICNFFIKSYVSILRGTPLILQLSLIYFALQKILGIQISIFTAGVIAFSINSSAYISEHLRAGINAIDKGQLEACKALGMTKFMSLRLVIIPQAFVNIIPSLINEMINMIKESSIISVLGALDIMRRAQLISSETYDYLTPLIIAGCYYYILVTTLNFILSIAEKKLKNRI